MLDRFLQFLGAGIPRESREVEVSNDIFKRLAFGKLASESIFRVLEFFVDRRSIEKFDRHAEVGVLGALAGADGRSFRLPEDFQEIDFGDIRCGNLRSLRTDR